MGIKSTIAKQKLCILAIAVGVEVHLRRFATRGQGRVYLGLD